MKPQEFQILQTKNLELKPLIATFDFAKELFDIIANNRDFFKYMPWINVEKPEQEFVFLNNAENGWKKQTEATYRMCLRDGGDFVGLCSIFNLKWERETAEIGYWLNPKYAGRGLMSEAVNAVADSFFNMGFKRITILANPENIASCRVAEKCGFQREGIMRSYDFAPGLNEREDIVLYAKVKEK